MFVGGALLLLLSMAGILLAWSLTGSWLFGLVFFLPGVVVSIGGLMVLHTPRTANVLCIVGGVSCPIVWIALFLIHL